MSDAVAPSYALAPHLGRFAVVFALIWIILSAVLFGVASTGLSLPMASLEAAIDVGACAGAVTAAGRRYSALNGGMAGKERHWLAIAYAFTASILLLTINLLFLAFDPTGISDMMDVFAQGDGSVLVVTLILVLLFDYALARLILHFFGKRETA